MRPWTRYFVVVACPKSLGAQTLLPEIPLLLPCCSCSQICHPVDAIKLSATFKPRRSMYKTRKLSSSLTTTTTRPSHSPPLFPFVSSRLVFYPLVHILLLRTFCHTPSPTGTARRYDSDRLAGLLACTAHVR